MAGPLIPAAPADGGAAPKARSGPARILPGAGRAGRPVVRRLGMLVLLLAAVFAAIELLPGDAADATAERGESAADMAARRAALGLDRPVAERFWDWMTGLPTGDLGTTAHGRPVTTVLAGPFPNTLVLGTLALALSITGALALGSWATLRPGGRVDRAVSVASTAAFALPEFVVSVALLLVFSQWTGWLPAVTLTGSDGAPASWDMLVLPLLSLAVPQIGWNTRIVRGALADQAALPHVQAAILDGLPRRRILSHHMLPGALPAIAVSTATSAGMLLGGAVVVETLFNYPGIGAVLAGAIADRDTPLVAGVVAATGAVISALLLLADLIRDRTLGARR
ncbi:ABC transporter permease [Kitasatospora sp. NPDC057223]|uniref:ABC transporter permease n=1 Tax=Kitasatospora sp. NPDC057223 TaxID=3346055 RepID=UPI0036325E38